MAKKRKSLNNRASVDILMIFFAFISIFLLIFEVVGHLSNTLQNFFQYADIAICIAFLLEFLYTLSQAEHKGHFFRKYWWELLAAIPITSSTTHALRTLNLLNLASLLELFRFIRLFIRIKIILWDSRKYTKQTALVYIMVILAILILCGAFGFYHFEYGHNPKVHDLWDSIYWASITTATVGYGDIYPVTSGGRVIAVLLIFSGIGTLGAFITVIESYIMKNR